MYDALEYNVYGKNPSKYETLRTLVRAVTAELTFSLDQVPDRPMNQTARRAIEKQISYWNGML